LLSKSRGENHIGDNQNLNKEKSWKKLDGVF
jgi:hypothetical protein